MTDRADLIKKMREMADVWDTHADIYGARQPNYRITAAILREAVKALEGGGDGHETIFNRTALV